MARPPRSPTEGAADLGRGDTTGRRQGWRLTFAGQFLLLSLVILLAGMTTIGLWIQLEVRHAVIARTAGVTALYVDSFISPLLQGLESGGPVTPDMKAALDRLLVGTPLGRTIVSFKVWLPDGTVVYSVAPELIGSRFEVQGGLLEALHGNVVSELSDLSESENEYERHGWTRLIETYAPVRAEGSGRVLAVSEFYQAPDDLIADISRAQVRSWLIVGTATVLMYLLLAGIARRASNTITRQQSDLEQNVAELSRTLEDNQRLHERTRRAAERTTALNERYLHRISADLHDGPAQDIALALLRMEGVSAAVAGGDGGSDGRGDLEVVLSALDSALGELRGIARGLRLPEIEELPLAETARRAVEEVGRLTGAPAALACRGLPAEVPLSMKITTYRVLHEALVNVHRHAEGAACQVRLEGVPGAIVIEVIDDGPGFDTGKAKTSGSLGLGGMRERIEMLGGTFEVKSRPGEGTTIRARLPTREEEVGDD